jgi:hypothetical protein
MRVVVVLVLLCATTFVSQAQNADVQAERATMDAALLRVMRGTSSPGTMAVWPQSLQEIKRHEGTSPSLTAFDDYANDYYSLHDTVGARYRVHRINDGTLQLGIDASIMVRSGSVTLFDTTDNFVLARPAVRFMGSFNENFGFFLDLSNGMRLRGLSPRIATTDPTLARTFKFLVEEQTFFDRYIGYVQYQAEHLRVRFGREQLQVGFSPIDNLLHSVDAPPMDGLLIDVPYKSVRFTSTHSMVDGVDLDGRAVPTKFIATHRLAIDPFPWMSVAVSDAIVYWNRGLDLAYLNPLAFFVSAGLGTADRSLTDNSMLAVDLAIRPIDGMMVYGAFLADDLSYSTIGDTSVIGNNNKWAWQLGISQLLDAGPYPVLLSGEYVRVDPFTYSHRTINASYTHLGAPVGYGMQPNSDRWAVQGRIWLSPRTSLRIDADYSRWGENILDENGNILMGEDPRFPGSGSMTPIGNVGGDVLRGDGDFLQGNRFLRGVMSTTRRFSLWFSGEAVRNVFTDLRVGYRNRTGGNDPGSTMFVTFELRVGY